MANMTLINNNKVTITGVNSVNGSVTTSVVNGGTAEEINTFNISGRVPNNKFFKIADVKVEVLEDKTTFNIPTSPTLGISDLFNTPGESFANSLRLKLKEVKKDDTGAVRSYSYDLLHKTSRNTSKADNIRFTLNQSTQRKAGRTKAADPLLRKITVGKPELNPVGGVRSVTVYADPGFQFYVKVNKLREIYDAEGNFLHSSHVSILDQPGAVVDTFGDGKEYKIIRKTMGSTGEYSFKQTYPAHSKFEDEVASNPVNYEIIVGDWTGAKTGFNYDEGNGKMVKRKTITQYTNPNITFRVSMDNDLGGHTQTITYATAVGGVQINTSHPYDYYKYEGRPNEEGERYEKSNVVINKFRFCFYVSTNGVFGFRPGVTVPVFNRISHIDDGGESFWTNTNPDLNGGTKVVIKDIINSIGGGNTMYLFCADVEIVNWGTKDVVMELDLDDVLTIT
jgi:hypothetical protein